MHPIAPYDPSTVLSGTSTKGEPLRFAIERISALDFIVKVKVDGSTRSGVLISGIRPCVTISEALVAARVLGQDRVISLEHDKNDLLQARIKVCFYELSGFDQITRTRLYHESGERFHRMGGALAKQFLIEFARRLDDSPASISASDWKDLFACKKNYARVTCQTVCELLLKNYNSYLYPLLTLLSGIINSLGLNDEIESFFNQFSSVLLSIVRKVKKRGASLELYSALSLLNSMALKYSGSSKQGDGARLLLFPEDNYDTEKYFNRLLRVMGLSLKKRRVIINKALYFDGIYRIKERWHSSKETGLSVFAEAMRRAYPFEMRAVIQSRLQTENSPAPVKQRCLILSDSARNLFCRKRPRPTPFFPYLDGFLKRDGVNILAISGASDCDAIFRKIHDRLTTPLLDGDNEGRLPVFLEFPKDEPLFAAIVGDKCEEKYVDRKACLERELKSMTAVFICRGWERAEFPEETRRNAAQLLSRFPQTMLIVSLGDTGALPSSEIYTRIFGFQKDAHIYDYAHVLLARQFVMIRNWREETF